MASERRKRRLAAKMKRRRQRRQEEPKPVTPIINVSVGYGRVMRSSNAKGYLVRLLKCPEQPLPQEPQ